MSKHLNENNFVKLPSGSKRSLVPFDYTVTAH